MDIIRFFKEKWNLVSGLALTITVVLVKFIRPPDFSSNISQGQEVDYTTLSRIVIAGLILIILVPFQFFNKKKHGLFWWISGVIGLILSIVLFFNYNNIKNRDAAYNEDSKKWEVIGVHLTPLAKQAVDSVKRILKIDTISPDDILLHLGGAEQNWPKKEIEENANQILLAYLFTITCFTFFLLFSVQALYCYTKGG